MAKRTKAVETPEDARLRKVAEETVREVMCVHLVMDRMQRAEAQALKYGMKVRELERTVTRLEAAGEVNEEEAVDFLREWCDLPFSAREAALDALSEYARSSGDSSVRQFADWARRVNDPELAVVSA